MANRIFHVVALVVMLALGGLSMAFAGESVNEESGMEQRVRQCYEDTKSRDLLLDDNIRAERHDGAVLSDAQDVHRICNSRPQRVIASGCFKVQRAADRKGAGMNNSTHLIPHFGAENGPETSPFRPHASFDYYVIALRHILC
ncbi:MAG: hypothetical protein SPI18_00555 [Prevotella sp.]|nr:hypothetical protein [Prevotella sp.]MDY6129777.1 hypothetical protein [Prevotella sp.]